MRMRRLALSRETLTELATTDLDAVGGGSATPTTAVATPTFPLDDCVALFSKAGVCDSYLRPCISHTCTR